MPKVMFKTIGRAITAPYRFVLALAAFIRALLVIAAFALLLLLIGYVFSGTIRHRVNRCLFERGQEIRQDFPSNNETDEYKF